MSERDQKSIVQLVKLFLHEGYQLSPEAARLLVGDPDPVRRATEVLEHVKKKDSRPYVITADMIARDIKPANESLFSIFKAPAEDWDFVNADTQIAVHGIHPYPARMIPQIACRLIDRYSKPYDLVLDPFCGSGTVVAESMLMKAHNSEKQKLPRNAIGIDINPLALVLAKVKSTPLDPSRLEEAVGDFLKILDRRIYRLQTGKLDVSVPTQETFPNIRHWFKDKVIGELAVIKEMIQAVEDPHVQDFFRVCFSLTVRKVSNIYNSGDTFIKRLSPQELRRHNPNVFNTFRQIVVDAHSRMKEFSRAYHADVWSQVIPGDARRLPISTGAVDLIVTSPPYGEEQNTISYTRWSKLSSIWLGFTPDAVRRSEKLSLGAKADDVSLETPSKTLDEILSQTARANEKLAKSALAFFKDYALCLKEMSRVLKRNGFCCIVIGNRSLLRTRIPMDVVTKDFGGQVGFKIHDIIYRNIPTKAIPWIVAKGETIAKENIIVLKKE